MAASRLRAAADPGGPGEEEATHGDEENAVSEEEEAEHEGQGGEQDGASVYSPNNSRISVSQFRSDGLEGTADDEAVEEAFNDTITASDSGDAININSLGELKLDREVAEQAKETWQMFIGKATSREVAGEALYTALFESAPSLQSLFTTPRAVQAMRFMAGLSSFVESLDNPPGLKILVETLGFGHLNLDVTVPRVVIFRDAILDLLTVEVGDKVTAGGFEGWKRLLNYVGGAIIFIRTHYAERLRVLEESWKIVNADEEAAGTVGSSEATGAAPKVTEEREETEQKGSNTLQNQKVPTTYKEMFMFNAAVMGFGQSLWMNEILACFDNIVTNVANSGRLQEECDVLVLRISKVANGPVNLPQYKSCMLASLRSLLPKDWSTSHEQSWSWLWENVERLLLKTLGQPSCWEKAYGSFIASLSEAQAFEFRASVYAKFFQLAPGGEDYFKQSTTYLHLIATKIMQMVLDMFTDPVRMVDDISALGLRHVGYGIPTQFFAPFVSAVIEVLQSVCSDSKVIEGTRWSLGLVAKSLVRTILEGSTIVMKAINLNTKASLNKAIACAPRGERSQWMLIVAVGTQNISPLAWAVEGGKLEAASAIIKDLLTFRADRDKYYYGADELFNRHPDLIKRLCEDAPTLVPEVLDGLIWRSRLTFAGQRRVNYFLKHLLVDQDSHYHQTLAWIAARQDPKLACHPLCVILTDLTWSKVASWTFLVQKCWFLLTVVVFILSQSVMKNSNFLPPGVERAGVLGCRVFIYALSLGHLFYVNIGNTFRAYRTKDIFWLFGILPIPTYLRDWQDAGSFVLMLCLMVMLCSEPLLYCIGNDSAEIGADGDSAVMFSESCKQAEGHRKFPYSTFSMFAMFLYYTLLVDLTVFNTRLSAYILACGRMLSEVGLFLLAAGTTIGTFACAFSCLEQDVEEFHGVHHAAMLLWSTLIQMVSEDTYESIRGSEVILFGVYIYVIVAGVFLVNMLIAQMTCSYSATHLDLMGFARLQRMKLTVETMATLGEKRWTRFHTSLGLTKKLEFNEGDVGLSGGIQHQEPASMNPTTVDMIQRFGGSTSPTVQWSQLEKADDSEKDRLDRMEKVLMKALARTGKQKGGGAGSSSGGDVNRSAVSGQSGGSGVGGGGDGGDPEAGSDVEEEEEEE